MKEYGVVDGGDAKTIGIGAMTEARWQRFLRDDGRRPASIPPTLDFHKAFTLQFVNKKVGMQP